MKKKPIKSLPPIPGWSDFCKKMGCVDKPKRRVKPRGIRKAGAGEFARCSRFAD